MIRKTYRSSRGPASPRPARDVMRLSPYAAPATGRREFLRLDLNENLRGCAPGVVERLRSIGAEDLTVYPEETGARAAVARRFGIAPPLDLVLCAGADEGIRLVCDAFVERGQRVVIIEPSYPLYRFYATLAGARVVAATCAEDLSFPERALREEVARGCRLLILGDPNNPTGTPLPARLVEEVALRHPETVILIDEAYAEFSGRSSVSLLGRLPNLVVARTFSKAYGLAGLRAGTLLGRRETLAWPTRIRSPYAVSHLALLAVEAALADEGFVERYVAEVRRARGFLTRGLRSLGVPCVPSAANFLIARFGPAAQAIRRGLALRRILVRDRSDQAGLRGTLRIGIGTEEQAAATLAAVRGALADLSGAAS